MHAVDFEGILVVINLDRPIAVAAAEQIPGYNPSRTALNELNDETRGWRIRLLVASLPNSVVAAKAVLPAMEFAFWFSSCSFLLFTGRYHTHPPPSSRLANRNKGRSRRKSRGNPGEESETESN